VKQHVSAVVKEIPAGVALKHVADGADRSAPVVESDVTVKASPAPAVFAELTNSPEHSLKRVESSDDRSAPAIEANTKVGASARPALAAEIKAKADDIGEFAARGAVKQHVSAVVKEIPASVALKHVTDSADRSAPVVESDVTVKASPAPAVFAELTKTGSKGSLKHVEESSDRSAPAIEADTKVGASARPALAAEIKARVAVDVH
jgi:hypothetical protein